MPSYFLNQYRNTSRITDPMFWKVALTSDRTVTEWMHFDWRIIASDCSLLAIKYLPRHGSWRNEYTLRNWPLKANFRSAKMHCQCQRKQMNIDSDRVILNNGKSQTDTNVAHCHYQELYLAYANAYLNVNILCINFSSGTSMENIRWALKFSDTVCVVLHFKPWPLVVVLELWKLCTIFER